METADLLGKPYLPRLIDGQIQAALEVSGAVVIEGPRGCGKTMSGANAVSSAVFLDDASVEDRLQIDPDYLLAGERPRLIDEWQVRPSVWNQVRREVDSSSGKGNFILTSSAVPADDVTRHTGAARFQRIQQRTMTWSERGLVDEQSVSLADLFGGKCPTDGPTGISYPELADRLCLSGFPGMMELGPLEALSASDAYLREITHTEIGVVESIRHDPAVVSQLLQSLARVTSTAASIQTIVADLQAVAPNIKPETVSRYLSILERIFVVSRLEAWTPRLRSRARLRTSPKWHLCDVSLAVAALDGDPQILTDDPMAMGYLFESQVVHDLTVMVEALGGRSFHFRDSNGYELDLVLTLPGRKWGAVEVKISKTQIADAVAHLNAVCEQIESKPAFKLVVTASGDTFTTQDGVVTCPLSALRL